MYVKWEHRDERRGTAAVLVEASRVNGKPRQRHIAYLGTYPGWLLLIKNDEDNVHRRAWFWHDITQRLASLDLTAEQRSHIKTLVAKRVPKPTTAEITAYDQTERARRREWWIQRGEEPPPHIWVNWPPRTRGVVKPPPRKGPNLFPNVIAAVQGKTA
jgi:hypothetical protein